MRRFGNFGWITGVRCPSGALLTSTSLQVCFCDAIYDISETPYLGGVTLSVDGDTTTWTLSSPQAVSAKCLTYDISAAIDPGSVIIFQYDGTWIAPADAVDISVSNTLDGA